MRKLLTALTILALSHSADARKPVKPAPLPAPAPAPSPTPIPTPGIIAPIASNFDPSPYLVPSWGSGAIPPSAAPDVVGAFRFNCEAGPLLRDDPIAYPGQPGASHLHQFFGNTSGNANSIYQTLRASGESNCENKLNRSLYWMPAMLDGKGNAVRPDFITIYYKRRPKSDPKCSLTSGDPQAEGNCVGIPTGLKMIFGYDMITGTPPTGAGYFNCDGPGATQGHYPTITAALPFCPVGSRLGAVISAPSCWDGKNLDSPNHRSHVSYPTYGWWGYPKCDPDHPFTIPTYQQGVWWTVDENLKTWHLSSDEMMPGTIPGTTFHADYFEGWDDPTKKLWEANCINRLLSCSGGDLGNGKQLKRSATFSWNAVPRLVPIP